MSPNPAIPKNAGNAARRADVLAFAKLDTTQRLAKHLRPGAESEAGGLWGASAAMALAALVSRREAKPFESLLVVTGDDGDAETFAADLATFDIHGALLPRQDFDVDDQPDPTTKGRRARALASLADGAGPNHPPMLIASVEALLQDAPVPDGLSRGRHKLAVGAPLEAETLLASAKTAELRRVPVVLSPGEVSLRGDVLDILPYTRTDALRIEFFDGAIDSIRTFDPATQQSLEILEEVSLALGGDVREGPPWSHLRGLVLAVFHEPLRVKERIKQLVDLSSPARRAWGVFEDSLRGFTQVNLSSLPTHGLDYKVLSAGSAATSGEADPVGRLRSIRGLQGGVHLVCGAASEQQRLVDVFARAELDLAKEQVETSVGALSRGFRVSELGITYLSNVEFAGVPARSANHGKPKAVVPSRAVQSFFELGPGDLVVHAVHGIARFSGMERVERGEGSEDHLRLTFRDDVTLLVPASKIHLVQKYIGSGGRGTTLLDKLGGKGFQKRKEEVQQSLFDMAADLLHVQAQRAALTRTAFTADDELETRFLDGFPYQDTPDQAKSWKEIAADLESDQPMDRLLCGDVGFGKTELALRAAFRVAASGKQVAVLVPTTVLADQHARTFKHRFEPLGLTIDHLTRFRSLKDRRRIVEATERGTIDVLIGTHKILNKEMAYGDLGLVIVDEEQRFGVRQKEHMKRLRHAVDVLSLSATPIPRTLHASLLGIRAISTLTTPPPGRQDVETHVVFRENDIVQQALRRELTREGQTFLVRNRIEGLDRLATQTRELVPGATLDVAHGQMTETQLEKAVRKFTNGETDILVSTAIVENGLDIPRANTILVDRADMFGLAELHQLRGRVGRSDKKAYCYLMMSREHPPKEDAKKRLKALEEFSHLGAGFAIAMKDLEIRGAGNLLGPQQSGHIASVGYDMYCQLLRQAVDDAKEGRLEPWNAVEVDVDLRVRAFLPDTFVEDAKQRLEVLREMDDARDLQSAKAVAASLRDRFGTLPEPVKRLLDVFTLKHQLGMLGVTGVQLIDAERLVVRHPPGQPLGGAWLGAFAETRAVEADKTHLMLPKPNRRGRKATPKVWNGETVLQFLLKTVG